MRIGIDGIKDPSATSRSASMSVFILQILQSTDQRLDQRWTTEVCRINRQSRWGPSVARAPSGGPEPPWGAGGGPDPDLDAGRSRTHLPINNNNKHVKKIINHRPRAPAVNRLSSGGGMNIFFRIKSKLVRTKLTNPLVNRLTATFIDAVYERAISG